MVNIRSETLVEAKKDILKSIRESEHAVQTQTKFTRRFKLRTDGNVGEFFRNIRSVFPIASKENHLVGIIRLDKQQPIVPGYIAVKNVFKHGLYGAEEISRYCEYYNSGSPLINCTLPISLGESIKLSRFIHDDMSIKTFPTGAKFISSDVYRVSLEKNVMASIYDINGSKGPCFIELSHNDEEDLFNFTPRNNIQRLLREELKVYDDIYYYCWTTLKRD